MQQILKHPLHFPIFLPQIQFKQSIKNPNETLNHLLKFNSKFPKTTSKMSSWSCLACTFLNPPSQKLTCQICQTPSTTTTTTTISTSPHKWACKACTFLNSYTLTNCEICDTRVPTFDFDDFENNSSSSDVGSIFFPLRKCGSSSLTPVLDPDDPKLDSGFQDKVRIQMGTDHLNGSPKILSSNKRKFEDTVSESEGPFDCVGTINKEDNGKALTDLGSAETVDDSECSIVFKRKRDPSESAEKPVAVNGFRDVKSSKKQTTLLDEKVRTIGAEKGSVSVENAENGEVKNVSGVIKIMSYNVWFRDELEGHLRMQAIGNLIQLHSPDVICFQEVNSVIYAIFQKSSWWKKYRCSVSFERSQNEAYFCMQLAKLPVKSFSCRPFSNTMMCRELCIADIEVNQKNSLVIATTHLESPCPGPPKWDQMYSKERVTQAQEAITVLNRFPNVIFCGDMNWDDKQDGQFPFTDGWFDAWEKLRPTEVGYTYDTKSNKMLTGNRTLQKRLDRFICHLPDFTVSSIEMIGTKPIQGLEYKKEKKLRGKIQELLLPVYPSDHYGLLLTVTAV
ncbi:hypothetical protein RND81_06G136200 [Saponaria officinalis]|uniref:RanBP2-type domain-containing protein n=1 Tax=Saponaria officinalis TaxID=3572 RepID=A0AAW1KB04_SAPOF